MSNDGVYAMSSKHNSAPRLVIIEGNDKGKVINLHGGTAVIGRSKGDVLIHDPRVSRSHVAITFDEKSGTVSITDLKSLNGTLINGKALETSELKDGDKILLGNTLLDCQIGVATAEPTLATEEPSQSRSAPAAQVSTDSKIEPHFEPGREKTHPSISEARSRKRQKQDATPTPGGVPPKEPVPRAAAAVATEAKSKSKNRAPARSLREMYTSLPRKARIYALCGTALVFALLFNTMSPSESPEQRITRDTTSIRKLEAEGKLNEAVAQAETLTKSYPKSDAALRLLADLYIQQGKTEAALNTFKAVLALSPKDGYAMARLTRLYLMTGAVKDAEEMNSKVDRVIVEGPHTKEFFLEVGNLYLDFRQLDVNPKKMIIIGQALQNTFAPGHPVGMKLEAVGLLLSEAAPDAVKVLEKARLADPEDQSVLQYLVFAKVKASDLEGASQTVQNWITLFPNSTQPLIILAHWKYEAKEYNEALSYLQKISQLGSKNPQDPSIPDALNLMGKLYAQQGQRQEAEQVLRQSCQLGFQASCDHELVKGGAAPAVPPSDSAPSQPPAQN